MTSTSTQTYTALPVTKRADYLIAVCESLPDDQLTSDNLTQILTLAQDIPPKFLPTSFHTYVAKRFSTDLRQIARRIQGAATTASSEDFEDLVPHTGFLHDYINYTYQTEPPTAFHFFSAVCILGAILERRVSLERGDGTIYPNVNIVLIGPSGRVRKTTAAQLAIHLFEKAGGNLLANKLTAEGLTLRLSKQQNATGLIYAAEWAVLLGRQQYMEGIIPTLTDFFDCKDHFEYETASRGTVRLQNLAISHLACTTPDWMQSSITRDAFAGGFMSRLLFVLQRTTPRIYSMPPKKDPTLEKSLISHLVQLKRLTDTVKLTPPAERWYDNWYTHIASTPQQRSVESQFDGYYARKPVRVLQLAIILCVAADPTSTTIKLSVLKHSLRLIEWLESFLPGMFDELASTAIGDDQLRLLRQLRQSNGELHHADWLNLNRARMTADAFRRCLDTLLQARTVVLDRTTHTYFLLNRGYAKDE